MKQKIADFLNIFFGFRKTLLMVILYIVGIIFRITGLLSGAEMVDLFKGTTIAFMSANGLEHIVEVVKQKIASTAKSDAPEAPSDDESTVG